MRTTISHIYLNDIIPPVWPELNQRDRKVEIFRKQARNKQNQGKMKQLRWTASKGLSSKDLDGPPVWKKLSTWIWRWFSILKHKMRNYLTTTELQAREESKILIRMSLTVVSQAEEKQTQRIRLSNEDCLLQPKMEVSRLWNTPTFSRRRNA